MAENQYQPISCDDHDLLEAASVERCEVELEFNAQGVRQRQRGLIGDVYSSEGAEFVRLDAPSGSREIRLDKIISMREIH